MCEWSLGWGGNGLDAERRRVDSVSFPVFDWLVERLCECVRAYACVSFADSFVYCICVLLFDFYPIFPKNECRAILISMCLYGCNWFETQ